MNKTFFPILLISSLLLFSCKENTQEPITLHNEQVITTVPSASGIVCKGENIWMIGDDASSLYELDSKNEILSSYQVSFMSRKENGRINKAIKPDFESMDYFDNKIIVMGSGSSIISRDTAVIISYKTKEIITKMSFRLLFDEFLRLGKFDSTQSINMEGLASDDSHFYLLHRGNICGKNLIFQIEKKDFLQYIGTGKLPKIKIHHFELPKINGFQSGFSGACISPDKNYLLFTSSVESTSDVYHDGEVLGSFIGMIPITGANAWSKNTSFPLMKHDSVLATKLESICIKSQDDDKLNLVCVSDNDNGESGIYQISIDLNFFKD